MSTGDHLSGWTGRLQTAWLARGPLARALWPLSLLYGALSAARRTLYRLGWRRVEALGVPVIVVGNLIAGGAGKTPTVLAVIAALRSRGFTPGIVSRGHGRDESEDRTPLEVLPGTPARAAGDEPLLLRLRSGAPVVVGRARVAAGRELRRLHPGVNVIVSDDGLQHLALARDAQILVFDERGAGNGWLLPAGPLREPLPRRLPPRTVVLYNAPAPTTPLPGSLARRALAGAAPLAEWWRGGPISLATLQSLRGRPLLAAAGLARPNRFFEMLRAAGLKIDALPLPDHFDFATLPWPAGAADVIVTEKDAVKLDPARFGATRVWVAALDFALDAAFETTLFGLLPAPPPGPTPPTAPAHGSTPA